MVACYLTVNFDIQRLRGQGMSIFTVCDVCGNTPAARIKLRRGVGLVLMARVYTSDINLCESCASSATSEYQKKTLVQGWTSPRSAVMNPFYVASNVVNRAKHKRRLRDE